HVLRTRRRSRPVRGRERPREGAELRRRPGLRAPAHGEGARLWPGRRGQREVARRFRDGIGEARGAAIHRGLRGRGARDPRGGHGLRVAFATDRAGIVGDDGRTHQGLYDISYLRILPGMTLMAPKDEAELRQMLWTAYRHAAAGRGPVGVRFPRGTGFGVSLD